MTLVMDEVQDQEKFSVEVFGIRMSPTIAKLAEAMAKAQGEIENAKKDTANDYFKSRYADLASVREAIRVPLAKYGLAVMQLPASEGKVVTVTNLVTHSSGEWIASVMRISSTDEKAQSTGSAVTYARRYSLMGITGIAPDDDDGNAASGRDGEQRQQGKKPARQQESAKTKEVGDFFTGEKEESQPIGKKVAVLLHGQYGCKNAADYSILVGHVFSDPAMKWDQVKNDDNHMKAVEGLLKDACEARGVPASKLLEDIKAELAESKELQGSL